MTIDTRYWKRDEPVLPTNGYLARLMSGLGGWFDWNYWDWSRYPNLMVWYTKFHPIEDEC